MTSPNTNIGGGRPLTFCTACKKVDDHPKHQVFGTIDDVAPHITCCAARGCPDGSCDIVSRNAKGKSGQQLLALIQAESDETVGLIAALPRERREFTLASLDQNLHGGLVGGPVALSGADR